jgi:hypothetical protein
MSGGSKAPDALVLSEDVQQRVRLVPRNRDDRIHASVARDVSDIDPGAVLETPVSERVDDRHGERSVDPLRVDADVLVYPADDVDAAVPGHVSELDVVLPLRCCGGDREARSIVSGQQDASGLRLDHQVEVAVAVHVGNLELTGMLRPGNDLRLAESTGDLREDDHAVFVRRDRDIVVAIAVEVPMTGELGRLGGWKEIGPRSPPVLSCSKR